MTDLLKQLLELCAGLLGGQMTGQALERAGAGPDAMKASVTTDLDLPTGYDRDSEEGRQRAAIVARARSHIGRKYKLGAEIKPGQDDADYTDCSEEVEDDYRAAGKHIPDGSNYQYDFCRPVRHGEAGDLHFLWSDKWGRIGHVMIDSGEGTVIHALGGVGVCEEPLSKYTSHRRYKGCRRHPDFARPKEDRV